MHGRFIHGIVLPSKIQAGTSLILPFPTRFLLQDLKNGLTAIELHGAAWTDTEQSIITTKGSDQGFPQVRPEKIDRVDECRLLYLTACERHERFPLWPFKPLGAIILKSADLKVRAHSSCESHYLVYKSWRWNLEHGQKSSSDHGFAPISATDRGKLPRMTSEQGPIALSQRYNDEFVQGDESQDLSKRDTKGIFGWLRSDGIGEEEVQIYKHLWFTEEYDSEEEEELSDTTEDIESEDVASDKFDWTKCDRWVSRITTSTSGKEELAEGVHSIGGNITPANLPLY